MYTRDSLAALVLEMRKAQKRFFRQGRAASSERRRELLEASYELEGKVDAALAEIGGYRPLFDREEEEA